MITSLKRASALVFAGMLALAGCSGDAGDAGATGATGPKGDTGAKGDKGDPGTNGQDLTATAKPESCAVCHRGAGAAHQQSYNELYQDGVIAVTNVEYSTGGGNDVVTFKMTKAGVNFDCRQADSFGIYFTEWDGAQFPSDVSLKGSSASVTYDGAGGCTVTQAQSAKGDLSAIDGLIVVYGYDELVEQVGHINMAKYPFAAIIETKGAVNYTSAANVAGCEKCHTRPYLKHAYIYGDVGGKEFYTCKACHYDARTGNHRDWQLLVDNPLAYALLNDNNPATNPDPAPDMTATGPYAYKARLMNDVHMSHAMEFPYPQSMANCVVCHEGKLATKVLTDANFTLTTCKSCHPVTATGVTGSKRAPALTSVMPQTIGAHTANLYEPYTGAACNSCHKDPASGGFAPVFSQIHSGYNKQIYDASGAKYSASITSSVTSATYDSATRVLTVNFGVAGAAANAIIKPTVVVSLYGYGTKDFMVSGHGSAADGKRNLEWAEGASNNSTRLTVTPNATAGNTSWTATANLSTWATQIDAGKIKKAEIGFLPALGLDQTKAPDNSKTSATYNPYLAIAGVTKTFDLVNGVVMADTAVHGRAIINPAKCNDCHDALATTFHNPNYGSAGTVACRMCHAVISGGGHLEMQSRSIDSYVHAIHSFQAFDIQKVDFTDPVQAVEYMHHTGSGPYAPPGGAEGFLFPTFGITNCESCHNPGTYDVPDQTKSLPSLHSKSSSVTGWGRNIGTVPSYITGPASRACGGCHRAELIKTDDASGLAAFNEHAKAGGYLLDAATTTIEAVIDAVMSWF